MWKSWKAVLLVLLLIGSSAAIVEWQTRTVDLCLEPLHLTCTPDTQLIVRRATFRADRSQSPWDMRVSMAWMLGSVETECNGKSYCNTRLDESLIRLACGEPGASVVVQVEHGCAPSVHLQRACGGQAFHPKEHGFVVNRLYPEHNDDQRCTIIFMVGMEKAVTVRPMTLDVPYGWRVHFCNLTQCDQFPLGTERIMLTGNCHLRMTPSTRVPEPAGHIKFAFEYEVEETPRLITQQEPIDKQEFDPDDVGIIKTETRTKTAAIVAGIGIPTILVAILGSVYIYQSKHQDDMGEKLTEDDDQRESFDPCYLDAARHAPGRGLRISWGNGCRKPSLNVGSSSI